MQLELLKMHTSAVTEDELTQQTDIFDNNENDYRSQTEVNIASNKDIVVVRIWRTSHFVNHIHTGSSLSCELVDNL